MSAEQTFSDPLVIATHFNDLHATRRQRVQATKISRPRRAPLTKAERAQVLLKSGARCHICGGVIDGSALDADHVFAHSVGGTHSLHNYLPAHSLCNQYRWNHASEEFQWILKLGVWLRSQIERRTPIGIEAVSRFIKADRTRAARRKLPLP